MTFEFSHDKDFTAADLPTQQQAVQAALEFVKQVKIRWNKSKQYHEQGQVVHTYNTRNGNDFWMARVSHHPAFKAGGDQGGAAAAKQQHHGLRGNNNHSNKGSHVVSDTDITFDVFRQYVLEDHTENELKYIPLLDSYRTHKDEPSVIPEDTAEGWKGE